MVASPFEVLWHPMYIFTSKCVCLLTHQIDMCWFHILAIMSNGTILGYKYFHEVPISFPFSTHLAMGWQSQMFGWCLSLQEPANLFFFSCNTPSYIAINIYICVPFSSYFHQTWWALNISGNAILGCMRWHIVGFSFPWSLVMLRIFHICLGCWKIFIERVCVGPFPAD